MQLNNRKIKYLNLKDYQRIYIYDLISCNYFIYRFHYNSII